MGLPVRTLIGIVLAFVSTLIARTAFEISYRLGFYPEKWLADLTMGALGSTLAFWLILSVAAFAIWIGLEFAARRWLRANSGMPPLGTAGDDKIPGPTITQYLPATAPAILLQDGWILNFNPTVLTGRKLISFNSNGQIGEGRNQNEWTWSMVGDELEIRRRNGDLQNRFRFDPHGTKFISTNHPDAQGIRDQFIFRDRAAQNSS
ncbi:hypothetical protein [Bradyrhizobium cajani]|uniref:Uncharacterized protein n=1 Tax=Bradyrhizobium cajani TaxID=1928661 RepID=A0A844TBB8_9BRAD|nr:hypothetical protein [Bradyrhizobium cajani]MCP3367732.1 hypothetical protein [Bradyrhizobium cajani]MVT73779.1 hypothetical protein [Bradyrhizobium cajani]